MTNFETRERELVYEINNLLAKVKKIKRKLRPIQEEKNRLSRILSITRKRQEKKVEESVDKNS